MDNFKFFFFLLLLHYASIDAFYLKRAQVATKSFTKKHIFKNMSRLKKRFFSLVRRPVRRLIRRSFSEGGSLGEGGLFSPKIKKTIYKKPQMLKNVIGYQKKNILHKKSLNLKTSIKRYYQDSGDYDKVKNSLSFKYAQTKSLEELKDFFQKVTHNSIQDMDFAMKEATRALEQEQMVQAEKKFVAYHSMPVPIFLMLNIYTKIYDKVHNKITPTDFIYLRTFEDISNKILLGTFLENHLSNPFNFNDTSDLTGKKHLLSLCPFLFQAEPQESALNRNPLPANVLSITRTILMNILSNIGVVNLSFSTKSEISKALGPFETLGRINTVIQLVFFENENYNLDALEKNKLALPGESKDMYVGYDENHIFPNLYWSIVDGIPCFKCYPKYKGPDLLQKMLKGERDIDADIAQLRLLITPEYLKEKKYRVHIVDINNQFQDFDQKVNELTELILKEVEKSTEKKIIVD